MGKIYIGNYPKAEIVNKTSAKKVFIVGDEITGINADSERIAFKDAIMYKYYFRWLSELNNNSVLVLNNILKKVQRNCLEYNCIRYYAQNAGQVIVFNDFPIIESKHDFMILYDMIQIDAFWKIPYEDVEHFENVEMNCSVSIKKTDVTLSDDAIEDYNAEKQAAISAVKKDPDIIPRRLLKYAEKCKNPFGKFDSLTVLKPDMNVCVSQLKVDIYFYNELIRKVSEIDDISQKIQ